MNESAVLPVQDADVQIVQPIPAPPQGSQAIPSPKPKQKRFLANLRFNGLRYLVLAVALLSAWGLLEAALWQGAGTPEAMFMLALAGGLLAAAGKTAIDILSWAAANRQAVHVERMHAVQRVFKRARIVREHAVLDWRRLHTVLVDNLTGQSQEIRLFHGHDDTDRKAQALVHKAQSEETWIRRDGVEAVQRFKTDIATIDYDALTTEGEFLAAFNARMDNLRRDLALAAIGIQLD